MSWVLMLSILFFLILAGAVFNIGNVVNRKLATQNASDAVAYSSSLWIARGMNAMTATNHMMGELSALYVIHHGLGGKYMDEKSQPNNTTAMVAASQALNALFIAANAGSIPVQSNIRNRVQKIPAVDINSMLYDSKLQIKILMATAYGVHAAGGVVEKLPLPGAAIAGVAIQLGALAFEWGLFKEWIVLDIIERVARPLASVKKQLPTMIKAIYTYQQTLLMVNMPLRAMDAADEIAEEHRVNGHIVGHIPTGLSVGDFLGIKPTLPVEKENTTNERRSQLIRATHPWVHYWRTPINEFLGGFFGAPLSQAPKYYSKWTSLYTLQLCEWLRSPTGSKYRKQLTIVNFGGASQGATQSGQGENGKNLKMYVMKGLNGTEKSRESWATGDDSEIEKLFVHMGIAHQPAAPRMSVAAIFPQTNPQGFVGFSQSMIYNGNEQQNPAGYRGAGQPQPQVGWDTLNWTGNVPEYKQISGREDAGGPPRIKLNWQAKLTPVTVRKLASTIALSILDQEVRDISWRSKGSFAFMCH